MLLVGIPPLSASARQPDKGVPLNASGVPDLNLGARKFQKSSWPQRDLQEPNERWRLATMPIELGPQAAWSSLLNGSIYCSAATLMTPPGPFCNMKVAAYLLAARFAGTMLKGSDTAEGQAAAGRSYKAAYSTDKNMPWMVADYVLTQTIEQKGVGISKKLYGEAQVDAFLCSDPDCNVMVDVVTVVPSNKAKEAWCSGPPLSCLDEHDQAFQATPRRAVKFSHLKLDNTTAISMATIRDYPLKSYVRMVGNPLSGGSGKSRYEVVWVDDSPQWAFSDEKWGQHDIQPVVMPLGVLVRLAMFREFETTAFARDRIDYGEADGFSVLHYGVYKVHDFLANVSVCAAIVLPRNTWMNEHGWNVSDASCSGAAVQGTFLFDSYFMQAKYFDTRVVSAGTVDLWQFVNANNDTDDAVFSHEFVSDVHAVVNDTTRGLLFKPELGVEVIEGPLQLNKAALEQFGHSLGIRWRFSDEADPSTNAPQDVEYVDTVSYVDLNCSWSTCRLLSVGSALVVARLADFSGSTALSQHLTKRLDADSKEINRFYQGLLRLKFASGFKNESKGVLRQRPWCLADSVKRRRMELFQGVDGNGLMAICKQISSGRNVTVVSCSFDAYNCTRWDELGLGFAHGPDTHHSRHTDPPQGPSTRPLSDLLGDTWWKPIDKHSYSSPLQSSAYGYLRAVDVETALEDVCDGASSLLNTEMNNAMVATDSTKSRSGAVLDTTILVVAIVALAMGMYELQKWVTRMVGKTLGTVVGSLWVERIGQVVACAVIALSLVVAPGVTLAAELAARKSNPNKEQSKVGWLTADTGDGNGPYTVVAVVTVTITAQYDQVAFVMVIANLAVAAFVTCWLWALAVYKSIWQGGPIKQTGPLHHHESAA